MNRDQQFRRKSVLLSFIYYWSLNSMFSNAQTKIFCRALIFAMVLGFVGTCHNARATSIVTISYDFVSLSGDFASGVAPLSQTDYNTGNGPNYGAGDRSNNPFIFGFSTPVGDVFYLDYFGFGFVLSDDRSSLYANGSIAQSVYGGGFIYASFSTGADGITVWNGAFAVGEETYTVSGTGLWLKPAVAASIVSVPDGGSVMALLGISVGSVGLIFGFVRRMESVK